MWLRQRESGPTATAFPSRPFANDGLAGGLGVQRGGRSGRVTGEGSFRRPRTNAAPKVLQSTGTVVRNARGIDCVSGPVPGSGRVAAAHRQLECGQSSFALAGQPPSGHVANAPSRSPSRTV